MTAAPAIRDEYGEFLAGKVKFTHEHGFHVPADCVNPHLKPHVRDVVRWALQKGRSAIFSDFGLQKTTTQLEVMRLLGHERRGLRMRRLIVTPLGVRQEFARDAREHFPDDYAIRTRFIRTPEEIEGDDEIYLTNYESVRDGKLDPSLFDAASLDEASVLRSYGSKTYQTFLTLFDAVPFRWVATATPSPNRFKELIHYAGFLGVMDTGQALTRFFQRDSTQANNLTLRPNMEVEFFAWLHSWALFLQSPSDLGHSDEGYLRPAVRVVWHEVPAGTPLGKVDRDGQGQLITDASLSLQASAEEKRLSIPQRVAKAVEILRTEHAGEHAILWHHLEAERHAIQEDLPSAVSVYGTQDLDERERAIIDFSDGKFEYLSTKPSVAGSGTNPQRHCHVDVFVGINDEFNDMFQAMHRLDRFGQQHEVTHHFIITEAERGTRKRFERKWSEHVRLRARMREIIREYGLSDTGLHKSLTRTLGVVRREESGARFTVAHNDAVLEARRMPADYVDGMRLTSIPFGNHYEYSASFNDFGHNPDFPAFFRQMDFLTPEQYRTLAPGRLMAVHVKDRILFGNVTGLGFPTVEPFHADCIHHYRRHGFAYCGMITIVTDVVRENNGNYRLGYSEMLKDSTKMGVGSPEYVLLFRKPPTDRSNGYADVPVVKSKVDYSLARWQIDAHAFWRSSGNRMLSASELASFGPDAIGRYYAKASRERLYDFSEHVKLGEALQERDALPKSFMCLAPASHDEAVWDDVTRMRTLNGSQTQRGLDNHICPLQIDIVDRLIERYTNPGDLVWDDFAGIGTVPFRALHLGRRGGGSELKAEYFNDMVRYCREAEEAVTTPTLFDLLDASADEGAPV